MSMPARKCAPVPDAMSFVYHIHDIVPQLSRSIVARLKTSDNTTHATSGVVTVDGATGASLHTRALVADPTGGKSSNAAYGVVVRAAGTLR